MAAASLLSSLSGRRAGSAILWLRCCAKRCQCGDELLVKETVERLPDRDGIGAFFLPEPPAPDERLDLAFAQCDHEGALALAPSFAAPSHAFRRGKRRKFRDRLGRRDFGWRSGVAIALA